MIRVIPADEPAIFDDLIRKPGLRALAEMVGEPVSPPRRGRPRNVVATRREDIEAKHFPELWTQVLGDLMLAYREICAYSCFRIHPVTGARSVDHFVAKSKAWDKVYEWTNYRLACSGMNSRKLDFNDVLDPFEIESGWFQLEMVGFQIIPSDGLSESVRQAVRDTVVRLRLDEFRRSREIDAERYWAGLTPLQILDLESPFVASELRRQGRLNLGDT